MTLEEKSDEMIRDAERSKANILPQSCKNNSSLLIDGQQAQGFCRNFDTTAQMGESYMVIGGHLDETTQQKIVKGEYIDFRKLIPRDHLILEEDG